VCACIHVGISCYILCSDYKLYVCMYVFGDCGFTLSLSAESLVDGASDSQMQLTQVGVPSVYF
jgi:hypothetical protein